MVANVIDSKSVHLPGPEGTATCHPSSEFESKAMCRKKGWQMVCCAFPEKAVCNSGITCHKIYLKEWKNQSFELFLARPRPNQNHRIKNCKKRKMLL